MNIPIELAPDSFISLKCNRVILFVCLFYFLNFFSATLYGQDTTTLISKIESSRLTKDKINHLYTLCDTLRKHKVHNRLIHYAEMAIEYANVIDEDKLKIDGYYYLTKTYYSLRNNEGMVINAEAGLELATLFKSYKRESYFNNILGIGSKRKGDYNMAISYYEKALSINQLLSDSSLISNNYSNISLCYSALEDYSKAHEALQQSLTIRKALSDIRGTAKVYFSLGNNYEALNKYKEAIEYYINALEIYQELKDEIWSGYCLSNIGLVYQNIGDFTLAMDYYQQAKAIALKSENQSTLGVIYQNIGNLSDEKNNLNEAISYHKKALEIYKSLDDTQSINMVLLNIGLQYLESEKLDSSKIFLSQTYENTKEDPESYNFANVNIELGRLYTKEGNLIAAEKYLLKGLNIAENSQYTTLLNYGNLYLYELHVKTGNKGKALTYYKKHHEIEDSLNILNQEKDIAKIMAPFNFEKQQTEIALLNKDNLLKEAEVVKAANHQKLLFILLGFMTFVVVGTYYQFRFSKKKNKIILIEKERSEVLLLNILPSETAEELKDKGFVEAKRFDLVTVLFTDFVNFTKYAESVPPEDVVKSVDYYFSEFDRIVEKNNVEKIKTIGDAYMCVGGLPNANNTNPIQVVTAAMEILEVVKNTIESPPEGIHPFNIRIGINTGPVVAGIVGIHKFQYDIWGDTVNIASRMESNCIPGRINLSESTYNHIKDKIPCTYLGDTLLKNRGKLKMFRVT